MIGEEVIAIWDDGIDGAELYEVQKLVRCKDCKYDQTRRCPMAVAKFGYCDEDYCSCGDGERRTDE